MNLLIIFTAKYLFLVSGLIYVLFTFSLFKTNKNKFKSFILLSVISFPLIYLVAKLLGMIISDPRPFLITHTKPLIDSAIDNGFPSDHTLLTMALASIVFLYNRKLGIFLTVLALLVGIARVFAGVHHWLDIFGSICIAIAVAGTTYFIARTKSK